MKEKGGGEGAVVQNRTHDDFISAPSTRCGSRYHIFNAHGIN